MLNHMCPTKLLNEELVEDWPRRHRKPTSCPCCCTSRAVSLKAGYSSLQKHNFNQKYIKKEKQHFTSKGTVSRQKSSRTHYQRAARDKHLSWCKHVCGLENLSICTYCHKILPGNDLPLLRRHALTDRHKLRRKFQEHTSQLFTSKKKKSVLETSICVNHLDGSLKDHSLMRNQVLTIEKERRPGTFQHEQISKVADVSQEVLNSAMNCYVPLSPLPVQDFLQVKEWKHVQPVKPTGSYKPWSETAGPGAVINTVKETPCRSALHTHLEVNCASRSLVNSKLNGIVDLSNSFHYVKPTKDNFLSSLGLLPKVAALDMAKEKGSRECESLDVDEETLHAKSEPLTPTCTTSDPGKDEREPSLQCTRRTKHGMKLRKLYDSKTDVKLSCSSYKSLYSIDVTSPLGFLVRKHLRRDAFLNIRSDLERYCLTKVDGEALQIISLRQRRMMFRTTFQESTVMKHCHLYKFTRQHKKEFMKYVETGLNKQGRALLKILKSCSVDLNRLSKKEISKWTLPRCSVVLRRLSASEILHWTKPKSCMTPAAHHPSGFELSSPGVADVAGLQTIPHVPLGVPPRLSTSEPTEAAAVPSNRGVQTSLTHAEAENVPILGSLPGSVPSPRKRTLFVSIHGGGCPLQITYLPDITNLNQADTQLGIKSDVFSKADHWPKIQTDSLSTDKLTGFSNTFTSNTSLPCVVTKNADNLKRGVIKLPRLGHKPGHTLRHTPGHTLEHTDNIRHHSPGCEPVDMPGHSTGNSPEHTVPRTRSRMPGPTPGHTCHLPQRSPHNVYIRCATEGELILPRARIRALRIASVL